MKIDKHDKMNTLIIVSNHINIPFSFCNLITLLKIKISYDKVLTYLSLR